GWGGQKRLGTGGHLRCGRSRLEVVMDPGPRVRGPDAVLCATTHQSVVARPRVRGPVRRETQTGHLQIPINPGDAYGFLTLGPRPPAQGCAERSGGGCSILLRSVRGG